MSEPTVFSQEIFDEICQNIASGKSVKSICRADDMPAETNFFQWLKKDEKLRKQYADARAERADSIFEECLEIADQAEYDIFEDGEVNHEVIQRARLRIDTRKWMLGKMQPKKYGDQIQVDLTGDIKTTSVEVTTKDDVDKDDIGYVES